MPDVSDFISAGYYLIRANTPEWALESAQRGLLNTSLVSLSDCISPQFHISWGWHPPQDGDATAFGIGQDRLDALHDWTRKEFQASMEFPSTFFTLEAARQFVARFVSYTSGVYLIGAGLPQRHLSGWRDVPLAQPTGVLWAVNNGEPLALGGEVIGYDVVSLWSNILSHSWLCSGIHLDMLDTYGIRPNRYGLLDTEAEAQKVVAWIAEDEMQGRRAEPEPYVYWQLVSYSLAA